MCCFTREVRDVADTRIFARLAADSRQVLAYQMSLNIEEALAMVLPLPVPPDAGENAIRFINLEGFPQFFTELGEMVPVWQDERRWDHDGETLSGRDAAFATLTVHPVGRYEASFVPTANDFERLDARFRLPPSVLQGLGAYRDWGFAVFKLRESQGRETVHPMAFSFPTRYRFSMYFPTVHVHDGAVHPTARFDHLLYFQTHAQPQAHEHWFRDGEEISADDVPQWPRDVQYRTAFYRVADEFGKVLPEDPHYGRLRWGGRGGGLGPQQSAIERSAGVLEDKVPLHGLGLSGTLKNRDTWFHVDAL